MQSGQEDRGRLCQTRATPQRSTTPATAAAAAAPKRIWSL